jgi:hypothetical protein
MKRVFFFIFLLTLSGLALACGTDIQRERMAEKLYADADMQKFVCGSEDSCSMQKFKDRLQFDRYEESFRGKKVIICLVEPTLNARNSYTGIFAAREGGFEFQFISYGAGVKVDANRSSAPMIIEYSFFDPDNPDYSENQYLWNGAKFVFSRNVPQRN